MNYDTPVERLPLWTLDRNDFYNGPAPFGHDERLVRGRHFINQFQAFSLEFTSWNAPLLHSHDNMTIAGTLVKGVQSRKVAVLGLRS
jgi:hypothetical protein